MTTRFNTNELHRLASVENANRFDQKNARITTVYQKGTENEHVRSTDGQLVITTYSSGATYVWLKPSDIFRPMVFLADSSSKVNDVVDYLEVF